MQKTGHIVSALYWIYQNNARQRGYAFELSRDDFAELIKQNCYICGGPPSNLRTSAKTGAKVRYNGIDRVDNSLGYMAGNVMPCCRACNQVKGQLSLTDLKNHIERMLKGLEGL